MRESEKENVSRKKSRKKALWLFLAVFGLISVAGGVFFAVMSHRIGRIPTMTCGEMLAYTAEGRDDVRITVGILRGGAASFTVYGKDGEALPAEEYAYEIGSLTKTFTAALLCKAIGEGKLTADASVGDCLPLPRGVLYPSVKMLASHTSGYKNYYFDRQMVRNFLAGTENDYYGIQSEDLLATVGKARVDGEPQPFRYSNFGYAVIGMVLAAAEERDFAALLQDFLAEDLGLEETRLTVNGEGPENSWIWAEGDAYQAAGALVSTVGDLLHYLNLQIEGELPFLAASQQPVAPILTNSRRNEAMGIRMDEAAWGWIIDREGGFYWHNGGTSHYNSFAAFDRERRIGVVVLSNLPPKERIPGTVMGIRLMRELRGDAEFSL